MYTIFRGGYNAKHPGNFVMSRPNGLYCYLFLIVKSPAYLQIGDRTFTTHSTNAVIISPNTPYQYSGCGRAYINDWLYFDCTDEDFTSKYASLFNHPISLDNSLHFSQLFHSLIWENHFAIDQFRDKNVSMLLELILNKLIQEEQNASKKQNFSPYLSSLQNIRLQMTNEPYHNFTSEELADKLHISPSYFQFIYKNHFGLPFKTDLINIRINYAKHLIEESSLPFSRIALLCGYSNEIHFYRQFKAKTGMTPMKYRMSSK